jgi:hypothetical protein
VQAWAAAHLTQLQTFVVGDKAAIDEAALLAF